MLSRLFWGCAYGRLVNAVPADEKTVQSDRNSHHPPASDAAEQEYIAVFLGKRVSSALLPSLAFLASRPALRPESDLAVSS